MSKPKYQDLWAFILFYVHVLLILVLCIAWWSSIDDSSDSYEELDTTTSPAPTWWNSDSDADSGWDFSDFSLTGVLVALLASVVAGSMFGCLWLQCIRAFPDIIIKVMLGVQIAAWVLVAIVGIADDEMALCIIGLIIAAIWGLYTWW